MSNNKLGIRITGAGIGNTLMTTAALSPYIGRYASFRRHESSNTDCLVYRQEIHVGGRVVASVVFVLGVGVMVNASWLLFVVNDSRGPDIVSISVQLLIGVLLIATGIRSALETATISFSKVDSSVSFVRRFILPLPVVTANLANFDSVVIRPTIWGGGVLWHCVYLTSNDNRAEFGLFAEPNSITAKQKAEELSSFLEFSLDPGNA